MSQFGAEAQRHPERGATKLGYALAAAGAGDWSQCEWAMRRAWRYGPEGVAEAEIPASVASLVDQGRQRYQARLDRNSDDYDAAFMLAAIQFLEGDAEPAQESIQLALAAGDRSPSAANLRRLIEDRLSAVQSDEVEDAPVVSAESSGPRSF